jgi:AraC-like DNA-binding protein
VNDINYIDKLTNWFKKFKRYTVKYKNGAYHLYNLFNSPETMVESFDKMAFCKHDRVKKNLTTDNIFLKTKMFYCKLEEGCWVVVSNLHFKKNVLIENLYDTNFPIDYHFINIHIKSQTIATKSMINGLVLNDRVWSMFKAGQATTEYHFKNSNEKNITLFFTTKWLEKYKAINKNFKSSGLTDFFNSSNTYMILPEESSEYENIFENMMLLADENQDIKNTKKLKQLSDEVLEKFASKLDTEVVNENHFNLSDKDRKNIQRAEQFMDEHLLADFPGIEKIAKKVGVSSAKLKKDFKSIHNQGVYQYYSAKQMQVAYKLLSEKENSVREIATLLGYANASKFSTAFKKKFDISPSELNVISKISL